MSGWTIGIAGHGVNETRHGDGYTRPDLCPTHDHPPSTYHPQLDKTWCLCGAVIRPGNHVTFPLPTLPGGVLWSTTPPPKETR